VGGGRGEGGTDNSSTRYVGGGRGVQRDIGWRMKGWRGEEEGGEGGQTIRALGMSPWARPKRCTGVRSSDARTPGFRV